jgi:xanthine/uracil/vitamin C permease (AzgA family)
MSYIIVVNPAILSLAGVPGAEGKASPWPPDEATIIAAMVGTLMMAFYAKRPIAIAPYHGENAFIAFTVVLRWAIHGNRHWRGVHRRRFFRGHYRPGAAQLAGL